MGDRIERITPALLLEFYRSLSNEEQLAFLKLLALDSTAEVPFIITKELSIPEQARYSEMMFDATLWNLFPLLEQEAIRIAEDMPHASREARLKELHDRVRQRVEEYDRVLSERERATFKKRRDRSSDPKTIRRNVEICNLWNQRKHTQGQLAKKYNLKPSDIRKVLKEQAKWRQLFARLSPN